MKYFCTSEAVANYLQKHIVYRKRKIFFGDGKPESILGLISAKHKGENFLIATASSTGKDAVTKVFETSPYSFETAVFPFNHDDSEIHRRACACSRRTAQKHLPMPPSQAATLQFKFPLDKLG